MGGREGVTSCPLKGCRAFVEIGGEQWVGSVEGTHLVQMKYLFYFFFFFLNTCES